MVSVNYTSFVTASRDTFPSRGRPPNALRPPSRQEGVIKGETRCFPLEIASRLRRDNRASAEARAILRGKLSA